MFQHQIMRALLGATALGLATIPSPAAAQRIERIVAFGDSYADDGNLFQLLGGNPYASIYPTGRFSGGTNYVDTLSTILAAPVENFAIGGALTGNTNTNAPELPGFTFEYASFLGGGGGVFPTGDGGFDERDLVAISVGGNDARFYQFVGGTVGGAPGAAAASVSQAAAGLDALVAAGAPTISFLAGDASRLPEVGYLADPAGAGAIRSTYSNAFNSGMQDVLAGYAADGVIVHYTDLSLILDQIESDFGAFGFTGLACPPFPVSPVCAADPTAAAQYVFYGDQLHLTSAGFAVVARYVATQLQAPLTLGASSVLALDTAQQFGRTLQSRMDVTSGADAGFGFFVVGDTFSSDVNRSRGTDAFDTRATGATAGLTYGFAGGLAGVAVNYSKPKARFGHDASETSGRAIQLGGFASLRFGGGFVRGHLGIGKAELDIEREGVLVGMSASPDSSFRTAGTKAGYLVPMGGVRFGPVVALDHARAKVDGYTEAGDPALTLNVRSVTAKSLIGSVGAELQGDLGAAGTAVRPMLGVAAEKELNTGGSTIRFAQTSAPGIVNRWVVGGAPKGVYGRLTGGIGAELAGRLDLDGRLSMTLGRDGGDETSVHLGLRLGM